MVNIKASCHCGALTANITGEAGVKAVCHCLSCRKISGSAFSVNYIVPSSSFRHTSGNTSTFTSQGDSGKDLVSYFCPGCGVTLWRTAQAMQGMVICKAGTFDEDTDGDGEGGNTGVGKEDGKGEVLEGVARPGVEMYVKRRVEWCGAVKGVEEKMGAP